MVWSERQRGMLAEFGIRLWQPVQAQRMAPALSDPEERAEPGEAGPKWEADAVPTVSRRSSTVDSPVDARALDWPALRHAVENCTACALCEGRSRAVFGSGHRRAHWMVVGENPTEAEDAVGLPFVGAAGQLLANMLRAVGVGFALPGPDNPFDEPDAGPSDGDPAQQAYLAKMVKCFPPGQSKPTPAELAQCEVFLRRQIELVQPKVILALGVFAVRHLLRSDEPLGKLRGHVHDFHGVPLVFSYDPVHLLSRPQDKLRVWEDLCLAQRVIRREG